MPLGSKIDDCILSFHSVTAMKSSPNRMQKINVMWHLFTSWRKIRNTELSENSSHFAGSRKLLASRQFSKRLDRGTDSLVWIHFPKQRFREESKAKSVLIFLQTWRRTPYPWGSILPRGASSALLCAGEWLPPTPWGTSNKKTTLCASLWVRWTGQEAPPFSHISIYLNNNPGFHWFSRLKSPM